MDPVEHSHWARAVVAPPDMAEGPGIGLDALQGQVAIRASVACLLCGITEVPLTSLVVSQAVQRCSPGRAVCTGYRYRFSCPGCGSVNVWQVHEAVACWLLEHGATLSGGKCRFVSNGGRPRWTRSARRHRCGHQRA